VKKITAILVIFIFVGAALSAQMKPSAGFMALGDFSFGNGKISPSIQHSKTYQLPNFNFGAGTFFDGTYFEIFAGVTYGVIYYVWNDHNLSAGGSGAMGDTGGWQQAVKHANALELNFSVLGKYPIELRSITLFPIFGFNYNVFMYAWNLRKPLIESAVKTLSQFGLQAGAGIDYDFTSRIYLRVEALFQLRFVGESMKKYIDSFTFTTSEKGNYSSFPGIGPVIKAGFGFRI
jgi:hypothetical protein